MAGVCGPVTVVTAAEGEAPFGATVSSFASLSLSPPMITAALDRRSTLLATILRTRRFGVNVLGHGHDEIAVGFARRDSDRFDGIGWRFDDGLPRLTEAPGWMACRLVRAVDGGDHMLLLGEVQSAETRTAAPLVYGYRRFGTHSAYA
ncbi:flavin reductase family protein [Nocardia exalbida]|uniref:flavin reductase family protein n=1 Tax=Nocardia exalbida TaxID=290231 RepID=UPI000303433A|nr:flavin reductase family protein [Nocardia exalbida]